MKRKYNVYMYIYISIQQNDRNKKYNNNIITEKEE